MYLTVQDSVDILNSEHQMLKGLKINIVLKITFAKISSEETYFQSYTAVIIQDTFIEAIFEEEKYCKETMKTYFKNVKTNGGLI